jgi:hypothetical protein
VQVTLVVILKSGDIGAGNHKMSIKLQKPDYSYAPETSVSVFFQGTDDNGAMLAMPIIIAAPEEGLHWFDVLFEGSLLTRIPMRILHQLAMLQVQMAPPPGDQ